jgi:ATP synthase protein I
VAIKSIKTEAYNLVIWQLIIVMGLALILFLFQGARSGISTFLGGLAYCIPNFLFVWRVFARTAVQDASRFLLAFVVGETGKLFLSAVLFVLLVKYTPVKLINVLIGYVTAIVAFWIASFYFMSHAPTQEVK